MVRALTGSLLVVLALTAPVHVHADDDDRTIRGRVVDGVGGPIANATLTCFSRDDKAMTTTVTDARGEYRLPSPAGGRCFEVEAAMDGFVSTRITLRGAAILDFELEVGSLVEGFFFASVSGIVLRETLEPAADASVWVVTMSGDRVGGGRTDAHGRFTVHRLPNFHGPLVACARAFNPPERPAPERNVACEVVARQDDGSRQVLLTVPAPRAIPATEMPFPVLRVTPRSVTPTCVSAAGPRATLAATVEAHNPAWYPMLAPARVWTLAGARSAPTLAALDALGARAVEPRSAAARPGAVSTADVQAADLRTVAGQQGHASEISGTVAVPAAPGRYVMQVLVEPGIQGEPSDAERARLGGEPRFRPMSLWFHQAWSLPFVVDVPAPPAKLPTCR
jgi:hypothetical protein